MATCDGLVVVDLKLGTVELRCKDGDCIIDPEEGGDRLGSSQPLPGEISPSTGSSAIRVGDVVAAVKSLIADDKLEMKDKSDEWEQGLFVGDCSYDHNKK